jgi:hypothetical protein
MRILIFTVCLAAIAYGVVRVAVRYRASTGTTWERVLATAEGSATVLWSYIVAAGGLVMQLAGQGAEIFNMPEIKDGIMKLLKPEWVGGFLFLIGVMTVIARLRTLIEKDTGTG